MWIFDGGYDIIIRENKKEEADMLCESLPGIEWFANNNPYTECNFKFHYIILPDVKDETMTVKIWHGIFCYEKSIDDIVSERTFPLTNGGRQEMIEYIRGESRSFHQ